MARYTGPTLKRCRSLGIEPQAVGIGKKSNRNPKRNTRKLSEYGEQLREKQKAKFIYGMQEKPFRNLYERAERLKGNTGVNFLRLLELRFDNIVYRMGFAKSRAEARQLVTHGHFTVNGKKANIPSMTLKAGDEIQVTETSRGKTRFKDFEVTRFTPHWLSFDVENLKGSILQEPNREDVDAEVNERLIVELYSR